MLEPSPCLPALENLTKNPEDKALGTLSSYHVNAFSYTTETRYKAGIPWISPDSLVNCKVSNWKSQTQLDVSDSWESASRARAQILTLVEYILRSYSTQFRKILLLIWHFC